MIDEKGLAEAKDTADGLLGWHCPHGTRRHCPGVLHSADVNSQMSFPLDVVLRPTVADSGKDCCLIRQQWRVVLPPAL